MKIIDRSDDVLHLSIGFLKFSGATCIFDRAVGRAKIMRSRLFFPLKTIDVRLGEIAFAQVTTASGSAGEAGDYTQIYPEIFLTSGRRVPLAAASEKSTRNCVKVINEFLNREPAQAETP